MSFLGGIVTFNANPDRSKSSKSKFPASTILNNFHNLGGSLGVYGLLEVVVLSAYCSAFVVAKYEAPGSKSTNANDVPGSYRVAHALLHPLRVLLKPLLRPLLTPLLKASKQDEETGSYLKALVVSARSSSVSAPDSFSPSLLRLLYDVPPPPPPPAPSEVAKKAASEAAAGAVNVVRRKVREIGSAPRFKGANNNNTIVALIRARRSGRVWTG